jgi:hypothetical protein
LPSPGGTNRGQRCGAATSARQQRSQPWCTAMGATRPCRSSTFRRAGCRSKAPWELLQAATSRSSRSGAAFGPALAGDHPALAVLQRTAAAPPAAGQGRQTKARLAGAGQTLKRDCPEPMLPKCTLAQGALAHGVLGPWCWRLGAGARSRGQSARRGWWAAPHRPWLASALLGASERWRLGRGSEGQHRGPRLAR